MGRIPKQIFNNRCIFLNNFKSLFFLIIFISLSVIALRIWYKLCGRLFSEIKTNLSENYLFKSVRSIPLKYLLFAVTAAGIPLLIIIVFQFINFSLFIPSKYIPYNNIFDIPYYISKIIEHQNELNSISLNGNTYWLELYKNSFCVLSVLLSCFTVMYSVLYVIVNSITKRLLMRNAHKAISNLFLGCFVVSIALCLLILVCV